MDTATVMPRLGLTAAGAQAHAAGPVAGAGRGQPRGLLRMAAAGEVLAVPIEDVREILQFSRLTALPRTPDFVRGVMNLRGSVVPVIDLAARLGRARTDIGRRSCVVVVHSEPLEPAADDSPGSDDTADGDAAGAAQPLTVGLLVDAVYEVFERCADEIEPVPALGTRIAPAHLRGITRAAGGLVSVLALQQVLSVKQLAAAIAAHRPTPADTLQP